MLFQELPLLGVVIPYVSSAVWSDRRPVFTSIRNILRCTSGLYIGPLPPIFNIYAADLQSKTSMPMYIGILVTSCQCVQDVNWTIDRLSKYSLDPNLALNSTKAKWMLLSTRQMKTTHALEELSIDIDCSEKLLERVECTKLLGVHLNQHLSWQEHTTNLPSSCCATLTVFKKLRNFAPFHFRKRLAESLVLSKLDYCNLVYTIQRNSAFGAR